MNIKIFLRKFKIILYNFIKYQENNQYSKNIQINFLIISIMLILFLYHITIIFKLKNKHKLLHLFKNKIKQNKLILRVTDKSNHFYIGLASEFKKKVQKFFTDTNAYIELYENPFNELLNKVIQLNLINNLRSKKLILKRQYEEMMPDTEKTELAHLYFNPKTHKV